MSSVVRNLKIMSFMSTFMRRKSTLFTRIGNVITYIITIGNMILLNYAMHPPPPLWIRIVRIAENGMNMVFILLFFTFFYGFGHSHQIRILRIGENDRNIEGFWGVFSLVKISDKSSLSSLSVCFRCHWAYSSGIFWTF